MGQLPTHGLRVKSSDMFLGFHQSWELFLKNKDYITLTHMPVCPWSKIMSHKMIIYNRGDHGCVLITSDNIKQQAGAELGQTQDQSKNKTFTQ